MKNLLNKYLKLAAQGNLKNNFELTIFVTNYCNASCEHCFYSTQINTGASELNLESFKKLSRTIPPNCKKVILGGGEPFLREDILDIILAFKERGVTGFTVVTNGILTEKISSLIDSIQQMDNIDVEVAVSLDGPQEIHDTIRRYKGAFKKAFETLKILKEKKANVQIQTVVSRSNYQAIEAFDQYIYDNLQMRINYQFVRGVEMSGLPASLRRPFTPANKALLPSEDDMKTFLNILQRVYRRRIKNSGNFLRNVFQFSILESKYIIYKKKRNIFPCIAGINRGVLYPSGEAAICEYINPIKEKLAVFNYDFNKVWNSPGISTQKQVARNCYCTHGCFINIAGTPRFLFYFLKNSYRLLPFLVYKKDTEVN